MSQAGAKGTQAGSHSGSGDWWHGQDGAGCCADSGTGVTNPAVVPHLGARGCLTHATGRAALGPERAPDGLMPGCLHTALPFNGERRQS